MLIVRTTRLKVAQKEKRYSKSPPHVKLNFVIFSPCIQNGLKVNFCDYITGEIT